MMYSVGRLAIANTSCEQAIRPGLLGSTITMPKGVTLAARATAGNLVPHDRVVGLVFASCSGGCGAVNVQFVNIKVAKAD
ncbi:Uncharacterized protein APZ42_028909 [Daphnia magna]|uniref:Uncharacterized protein n=1 Tax=Daphnia magna TaxID=35525 RepID=A0A164Q1M0_9CRUS|nr:Uncharacterized protein APZ42_028909 [Daphnia magna]